MAKKLYDEVYDKLKEPIKIYLNSETKRLLESDCKNFEIKNKNQFYNTLISNYIGDYVDHLEKEAKQILEMMQDLIIGGNKDDFPSIARKIAYKNAFSDELKERSSYISLRVNANNTIQVAEMIATTDENVKVSVFFRNLFLNYLSLPVYKREQIIFADQYNKIMRSIKEHLMISYRNKNKHESRDFSVYSIKQSGIELHNYVIGSQNNDHAVGTVSIKLSSIGSVRLLNEKATFNSTFEECYKPMKDNGYQFGIDEVKYWKVYLTDKEYNKYEKRYLDRPTIYDAGSDEGGNYYIFNCSEFQLKNYFCPFGNKIQYTEYYKLEDNHQE